MPRARANSKTFCRKLAVSPVQPRKGEHKQSKSMSFCSIRRKTVVVLMSGMSWPALTTSLARTGLSLSNTCAAMQRGARCIFPKCTFGTSTGPDPGVRASAGISSAWMPVAGAHSKSTWIWFRTPFVVSGLAADTGTSAVTSLAVSTVATVSCLNLGKENAAGFDFHCAARSASKGEFVEQRPRRYAQRGFVSGWQRRQRRPPQSCLFFRQHASFVHFDQGAGH